MAIDNYFLFRYAQAKIAFNVLITCLRMTSFPVVNWSHLSICKFTYNQCGSRNKTPYTLKTVKNSILLCASTYWVVSKFSNFCINFLKWLKPLRLKENPQSFTLSFPFFSFFLIMRQKKHGALATVKLISEYHNILVI